MELLARYIVIDSAGTFAVHLVVATPKSDIACKFSWTARRASLTPAPKCRTNPENGPSTYGMVSVEELLTKAKAAIASGERSLNDAAEQDMVA